jgi:hypothetical protein
MASATPCPAEQDVRSMNSPISRLRKSFRARSKDAGRNKLRQLGLKPLALGADEAAALWDLSTAQFLAEVKAGNLPGPIGGLNCKRKLWSRLALKRAMKERDGGADTRPVNIDDDPLMNEIKSRAARKDPA